MRPPYRFKGAHSNPVVCGRRFCSACGRWRHVVDFAKHSRRGGEYQSRCRGCQRVYGREQRRRRLAAIRAYQREYQRLQRRARGVPPRQQWIGSMVVCGRRFCVRCGRWRLLLDFPHRPSGSPGARCYACLRADQREHIARQRQDLRWVEARREYHRIYKEAQRRAAGIPERHWVNGRPIKPDPSAHGNAHRRVDTAPLVPQLRLWLAAHAAEHNGQGLRALADAAVVPERRLWAILHGEQDRCHYLVADRLAVAMDLPLGFIYA